MKKSRLIFVFHLVFLGLYIFNLLELNDLEFIQLIYQLFGFFYITFLPGYLFVNLFVKNEMDISKKIIFFLNTIGLTYSSFSFYIIKVVSSAKVSIADSILNASKE